MMKWIMVGIVALFTQASTAVALDGTDPSTNLTVNSDPILEEPTPLPTPIPGDPVPVPGPIVTPLPDPDPGVSDGKLTGKEKAMSVQDAKGTKKLPHGTKVRRADGPGFQVIHDAHPGDVQRGKSNGLSGAGYPPTEGGKGSGKKK